MDSTRAKGGYLTAKSADAFGSVEAYAWPYTRGHPGSRRRTLCARQASGSSEGVHPADTAAAQILEIHGCGSRLRPRHGAERACLEDLEGQACPRLTSMSICRRQPSRWSR